MWKIIAYDADSFCLIFKLTVTKSKMLTFVYKQATCGFSITAEPKVTVFAMIMSKIPNQL